ncbi:hypothetical protein NGK36_07745 [Hafnia alvei]|uniref:hypothetical protein n=1 Tax=Hafniaceae TaxID=1903412 RepID=UPI0024329DA2|nr:MULTISPECIES: hypothetical protein [Hafniaceae]MEB7889190.1 hypothetical protein [Hafnia alvei]
MKTQYYLEIYEPEDSSCVAGYFESDTPFGALNIGEQINGASLNNTEEKKHLRIKDIQHIFWEIEGSHLAHKICVYTEILKR